MTSTKCRGWVTGTTVDTWQKKRNFFNDLSRQHLVGGFNPPNKLYLLLGIILAFLVTKKVKHTHQPDIFRIRSASGMPWATRLGRGSCCYLLLWSTSVPCPVERELWSQNWSFCVWSYYFIKEPWATPKIGLLLKVAILSKKSQKFRGGKNKDKKQNNPAIQKNSKW
jgi:hypothetical protein